MDNKLYGVHEFLNKHNYKKIMKCGYDKEDITTIVRCSCGKWALYFNAPHNEDSLHNPISFIDRNDSWVAAVAIRLPEKYIIEFLNYMKYIKFKWDEDLYMKLCRYYKE